MDFGSLILSICLELGLVFCTEPEPIELPPQDTSVLKYKPRVAEPKPEPKPEFPPIQTVIEKTVYIQQPAPKPEIIYKEPEKPRVDPALIAHQRLLALRRKGVIDQGFAVADYTLKPAAMTSKAPLPALSLPKSALDFGFRTEDDQESAYKYPAIFGGYPVDNTRIIRADRYINAIFETGVNSDIASADGGEAILVVESHIYGYHGRKVLIPKGSRLICAFGSADHANSTRLSFTCKRILMADTGVEIYQIAARVGDSQGYGGVSGDVDTRFWEKYGMAFMLTGISTAVKVAIGTIDSKNNQNLATSMNAGAEELSQRFGEITATVLEDKIDLKPIIRIAQGTPVTIRPANDWYIPPPDRSLKNG